MGCSRCSRYLPSLGLFAAVVALGLGVAVAVAQTYPNQACFYYGPGVPNRVPECTRWTGCKATGCPKVVVAGRELEPASCDTAVELQYEKCVSYPWANCKVLNPSVVCLTFVGYLTAPNCAGESVVGQVRYGIDCTNVF